MCVGGCGVGGIGGQRREIHVDASAAADVEKGKNRRGGGNRVQEEDVGHEGEVPGSWAVGGSTMNLGIRGQHEESGH